MTAQEFEQHERAIAMQTKLDILINDFQVARTSTDKNSANIFSLIRSNEVKLSTCRNDLEKDIERLYMTKEAGLAMESRLNNNFKSIKAWIVTTVGGFTAAGLLILWALNVIHISAVLR